MVLPIMKKRALQMHTISEAGYTATTGTTTSPQLTQTQPSGISSLLIAANATSQLRNRTIEPKPASVSVCTEDSSVSSPSPPSSNDLEKGVEHEAVASKRIQVIADLYQKMIKEKESNPDHNNNNSINKRQEWLDVAHRVRRTSFSNFKLELPRHVSVPKYTSGTCNIHKRTKISPSTFPQISHEEYNILFELRLEQQRMLRLLEYEMKLTSALQQRHGGREEGRW